MPGSEESNKSAEYQKLLIDWIAQFKSAVVALSGGVDSAVVAVAAKAALGAKMVAITGTSSSLADDEARDIVLFCDQFGIRHSFVQTRELDDPSYIQNNPDRCFHCKKELYGRLAEMAQTAGVNTVVDGTHLDDTQGHRPGLRAASLFNVRSPLLELRFRKDRVREIAHLMGIRHHDKPASPCLSSRIAYGLPVTRERLRQIDRAETFIRQLGFNDVRVRLHDKIARIEVPKPRISDLMQHAEAVTNELKRAGFTYVTIDLAGLRSGSLLEVINS